MKHLITLYLFLLVVLSASSQPYRSTLDAALDKLRQSNIDSIICYTPFQPDYVPLDTAQYEIQYSFYLCWKKEKDVFITKASYCLGTNERLSFDTVFNSVLSPDQEIYKEIVNNLELLKYQKVKPPLVKYNTGLRDTISEIRSSHPGYTEIRFILGTNEIDNWYTYDHIDDFHLRDQEGNIKIFQENVNREYNISTFVYKMTQKLSGIIDSLESKNAFEDKVKFRLIPSPILPASF